MEIVYILSGIVLGYFLFDKEQKALKEFKKYLSSPVSERLEVNWTTRQLLSLVSKRASERWYEARAHLQRNIFLSVLCTLRLVYVVRIDFIDKYEEYGRSRVFTLHGFQSIYGVMKKSKDLISVADEKINKELGEENKMYYYMTFVCGHNVVGDFMNGDFV